MSKKNNIIICKTTINGHEYTAQFNGTRAFYKAQNGFRSQRTGLQDMEMTIDYLVENVLVEPSNFDIDTISVDECEELAGFLMKVVRGRKEDISEYIVSGEQASESEQKSKAEK